MSRVYRNEYYLNIAHAVSQRSTCIRRKYGAIIVKDDRIISTGYNGAPTGCSHCSDIGTCWRQDNNIPSGQQYEKCRSVHAEANAIIHATYNDMQGATIYISGWDWETNGIAVAYPCLMCRRLLMNSDICKVIANHPSHPKTSYVGKWGNDIYDEEQFKKLWIDCDI